MRCLQGGVARNWRTPRSQRRAIQRDHSREQGSRLNGLLGFVVRTMPDGSASRDTNRTRYGRARNRAQGGHGTLPRACIPVQRSQHSEFRGVLTRSASVPAGRPWLTQSLWRVGLHVRHAEGRTSKTRSPSLVLRPFNLPASPARTFPLRSRKGPCYG